MEFATRSPAYGVTHSPLPLQEDEGSGGDNDEGYCELGANHTEWILLLRSVVVLSK